MANKSSEPQTYQARLGMSVQLLALLELKQKREMAGIKGYEMAALINIDAGTYSKFEKNNGMLDLRRFVEICVHLKCDAEAIFSNAYQKAMSNKRTYGSKRKIEELKAMLE